jgi:hypothetical protein
MLASARTNGNPKEPAMFTRIALFIAALLTAAAIAVTSIAAAGGALANSNWLGSTRVPVTAAHTTVSNNSNWI